MATPQLTQLSIDLAKNQTAQPVAPTTPVAPVAPIPNATGQAKDTFGQLSSQLGNLGTTLGKFKVETPEAIPSTMLGSDTTISNILNKQQQYQTQLMESMSPTAQETQLSQQLDTLNQEALQENERAENRQAPGFAVVGEQAAIERQRSIRAQGVARQLQAVVDQRTTRVDALKTALGFTTENITALSNLQKLTKPDVLGTQVNKQTGDVLAITQDPSGNITTKVIGNIGAEAQKNYQQTGTYTNSRGEEVFYGVTSDGQIKQNVLGFGQNAVTVGTIRAPHIEEINGVDMQWNPVTGAWETIRNTPTSNALGNAISELKVDNINNILNNPGMDSAVGPSGLARTDPGIWAATKRFFGGLLAGGAAGAAAGAPFAGVGAIPGAIMGALTTGVVRSLQGTKDELTGDRQNFIGSVVQMTSELTKDKLAQAKGQGVTFGALSDGERELIANAATKISNWAVYVDGDKTKPVIGYNIDEKSFKKEMDTINYLTKLDAIVRGATPESVGAVENPDGTVWIMNSDGTLTQLIRQ